MKNNAFKDSDTGLEFIIADKDQITAEEASFALREYIEKQKTEGLKIWLKKYKGFQGDLEAKSEEIWQTQLQALTTQKVPIVLWLRNYGDTE